MESTIKVWILLMKYLQESKFLALKKYKIGAMRLTGVWFYPIMFVNIIKKV